MTFFNGTFVEAREFEQVCYREGHHDLPVQRRGGSADRAGPRIRARVGFGHVDDPTAIMHYKFAKQDMTKPVLTGADLELLTKKFGGG